MKAWELLEQKGWCQGAFVSNGRHCAMGALREVYPDDLELWKAQGKMLSALEPSYSSVTWWNDRPERTKEEVIAKLKEADV